MASCEVLKISGPSMALRLLPPKIQYEAITPGDHRFKDPGAVVSEKAKAPGLEPPTTLWPSLDE
jgi:hypothetical protein